MGKTPDRFPGSREEDEIVLNTEATDPTVDGAIRFVGGAFKAKDGTGVFDLRSGAGLSAAQHNALRQLIHFLDDGPGDGFASGAFREITGTVFPSSEIWWETSSKLKKIVELSTTYAGSLPTTEAWKVYDTDGTTVLITLTDSITYSGVFESNRTRTWA